MWVSDVANWTPTLARGWAGGMWVSDFANWTPIMAGVGPVGGGCLILHIGRPLWQGWGWWDVGVRYCTLDTAYGRGGGGGMWVSDVANWTPTLGGLSQWE